MTVDQAWSLVLPNPGATLRLGRLIGELLQPGDVLALTGLLGSGKTHLIKGVAAGIRVPSDEPIASPTFVLVHEYLGRLRLYHLDAYRLSGADELVALGFEDLREDPLGAVAIEWADRVPELIPPEACRIALGHMPDRTRQAVVAWPDARRLTELCAEWELTQS